MCSFNKWSMFVNVAFNLSAHWLCCHLAANFCIFQEINSGSPYPPPPNFPFKNYKFEARSIWNEWNLRTTAGDWKWKKSSFVNQRSRSETLQCCTNIRIISLCSSFSERCAQGSNKHAEAADLWKIIPPLSFIQQFEDYRAEGLACCVVEKCDRPAVTSQKICYWLLQNISYQRSLFI